MPCLAQGDCNEKVDVFKEDRYLEDKLKLEAHSHGHSMNTNTLLKPLKIELPSLEGDWEDRGIIKPAPTGKNPASAVR